MKVKRNLNKLKPESTSWILSFKDSTRITIEGKISDERFMKMSATYEAEQNQLTERVAELEHIIDAARE